MGLMDFFGGPLSEKKIEKISKLASNPFAQPDIRMREMMRLLSDGGPGALRGVIKRFAANANGAIADEDPSFSDWTFLGQLIATGLFESRPLDKMGIGGFYTGLTSRVVCMVQRNSISSTGAPARSISIVMNCRSKRAL